MAAKNAKKQNLQKEHAKIVAGGKKQATQPAQQQWAANGDFFTKFSLYKETSAGFTSANTTYRP